MELNERDFARYLQESCPDTPEHFRRTVEQAVAAQCGGRVSAGRMQYAEEERASTERMRYAEEGYAPADGAVRAGRGRVSAKKRRNGRLLRVLLPAAAALTIGCGAIAVGAAGDFSFAGLLERWGITKPELAQTELVSETSYAEGGALLTVQDYYIDGTKLIFSAVAGDVEPDPTYGELQSKDHAEINGADCLVESFGLDKDTGIYVGSIHLPELEQADTLEVKMRLYTASGIQEFTFAVEGLNLSETRKVPDQECEITGGTVQIKDISISPSATKLTILYRFAGEDASERAQNCWGLFKITDSSGNEINTLYGAGVMFMGDPYESDGAYYRQVTFEELHGFDIDAESLRFVPYEPETDSEGKVIPDGGTVLEEEAFTVKLKE